QAARLGGRHHVAAYLACRFDDELRAIPARFRLRLHLAAAAHHLVGALGAIQLIGHRLLPAAAFGRDAQLRSALFDGLRAPSADPASAAAAAALWRWIALRLIQRPRS